MNVSTLRNGLAANWSNLKYIWIWGGPFAMALTAWDLDEDRALSRLVSGETLDSDPISEWWEAIALYLAMALAIWAGGAWARVRWGEKTFLEAQRESSRALAPWSLTWLYVALCMWTRHDQATEIAGRMIWILALAWSLVRTGALLWHTRCNDWVGRIQPRRLWFALIALAILYIATFGTLSIIRHNHFHSNMHDLGLYDQMMWNTLRGRWFRCTQFVLPNQEELIQFNYNFMAEHFMLILVPLLPFYALWQDPRLLLLLQTLALAGGGVVLFVFTRRALGAGERARAHWLAFALGASFLLHPLIQQANVKEFHADVFEPILIFWMGWALFARRPWQYGLAMLAALSCKEDVSVSMAAFGLYLLVFEPERRRWGLTALVSGVFWYLVVIKGIMPYGFRNGEAIRHMSRYAGLAPEDDLTMGAVVKTLLFNPVYTAHYLADPARLGSILLLAIPVVWLPLRFAPTVLIFLPSMAAALLVNWPIQYALDLHYGVPILPWVYVATIMALARHPALPAVRSAHIAALVLATSFLATVHLGRSPWGGAYSAKRYRAKDSHAQAVEAIRAIPPDAAVSAHTQLGAHLTARKDLFQYPILENADYIILDISPKAATFPLDDARYRRKIENLRQSVEWEVFREWPEQYVIFKKKPNEQ